MIGLMIWTSTQWWSHAWYRARLEVNLIFSYIFIYKPKWKLILSEDISISSFHFSFWLYTYASFDNSRSSWRNLFLFRYYWHCCCSRYSSTTFSHCRMNTIYTQMWRSFLSQTLLELEINVNIKTMHLKVR